jgi:hypothetical protein
MFHVSLATQESNRNLPSAWQCKAAHKFEDWGSHHTIWFDSVTPFIVLPHSGILRFPPIWSRKDAVHEVWDWLQYGLLTKNLAAWAGQGMVPTCHTHTFSLLSQGSKRRQRLCGKKRHGVKPSLCIMCNFCCQCPATSTSTTFHICKTRGC